MYDASVVPTRVGVNRAFDCAAVTQLGVVPTRVGVNRYRTTTAWQKVKSSPRAWG